MSAMDWVTTTFFAVSLTVISYYALFDPGLGAPILALIFILGTPALLIAAVLFFYLSGGSLDQVETPFEFYLILEISLAVCGAFVLGCWVLWPDLERAEPLFVAVGSAFALTAYIASLKSREPGIKPEEPNDASSEGEGQ